MIVKEWIEKAEFNQETGELTIIFVDGKFKIMGLYRNNEKEGILHFK